MGIPYPRRYSDDVGGTGKTVEFRRMGKALMTRFHIIIPARLKSSRLPGKMLIEVAGKTIIEHVYRRIESIPAQSISIATDSDDIARAVKRFGADVILTQPNHPSGTDRIAEAARILGLDEDDVIVNVQGDEPEMNPELVTQVARLVGEDWSSLYWPIEHLADLHNPNVVKVVLDNMERALYFSRSPIPYDREHRQQLPICYRHIGLYGYRNQSLQQWVVEPQSLLEKYECLEQLRAISLGMTIQMQRALFAPGQDINTIEDLNRFKHNILEYW
jgi:3-deoxy-manno-octulosonate cytidylyltransferase (CMP-KDO synthetase)